MGIIKNLSLAIIAFAIRLLSFNRFIILNYHRIHKKEDCFFASDLSVEEFTKHIKLIKKYLTPLDLHEALILQQNNTLPKGAIVITFDDGYKDNYQYVLPLLQTLSVPAVFYIATGFLNGGIMWNDAVIESIKNTRKRSINLNKLGLGEYSLESRTERLNAIMDVINRVKYHSLQRRYNIVKYISSVCDVQLPVDLMMDDREVVELAQCGMTIGGHTHNHPILVCETKDVIWKELLKGKQYLEQLIGQKVIDFAYPNGKLGEDFHYNHTLLVKDAGFKTAVTTDYGSNTRESNLYQLHRFTPWDKTEIKFLLRLLKLYILRHP